MNTWFNGLATSLTAEALALRRRKAFLPPLALLLPVPPLLGAGVWRVVMAISGTRARPPVFGHPCARIGARPPPLRRPRERKTNTLNTGNQGNAAAKPDQIRTDGITSSLRATADHVCPPPEMTAPFPWTSPEATWKVGLVRKGLHSLGFTRCCAITCG